MEELLRVGIISSTHGIHGEVKVFPTTEKIERFKKLKQVILDTGEQQRTLEVERVKFFKQFVILKFKGIDNINEIEPYRGKDLLVTREYAIPLEEGEYFIADLIGLRVVSDQGKELGILKDVLQTGANDVYIVERKEGKDLLIPAILQCILKTDLEEKQMTVHLLDGLEDL